jgi:glycosyltransferase involved in cell wall biosynthesis
MILVSVVIPVFNNAENLRNCLTGLKLLVTSEIQVVVIDDGSTDQSPFVAASFSEEFENFEFQIVTQNKGVGNARNLGLNLSLGTYVYFLDCDDTVSGNFSDALKSDLSANADLVFAPVIKIPSGSSNESHLAFFAQEHKMDRENLLSSLDNFESWPQECWGYYIRREFLSQNKIEFRDIRIAEDIVFMTEVFCKLETYSLINSPIYIHHRIPGSLGKSFSSFDAASWFKAFLGMVHIAKQFSSESVEGRLIANRTATVLSYFLLGYRANESSFERDLFVNFKKREYFQPLWDLSGISPDNLDGIDVILNSLLDVCSKNIQKLLTTVGAGKTYLYCYDKLSLGVFQIMKAQNFKVDGFLDDNIELLIPSHEISTMPITPKTLDGKLPKGSTFIVCHDKQSVYLEKKKRFSYLEDSSLRIVRFTTHDFVVGLHFEKLFRQNSE